MATETQLNGIRKQQNVYHVFDSQHAAIGHISACPMLEFTLNDCHTARN